MQTIVVTGATGFVARWVIKELLSNGYAVRGSVRNKVKEAEVRSSVCVGQAAGTEANLTFFVADLTSADGWLEGMRGATAVIHVASPLGHGTESTEELVAVARGGVEHVFTAAHQAGITRIVMTSSGAAATPQASVGAVTIHPDFWTDLSNPELDPYRISKVQAERAAWDFAKKNAMQLTTILPGAIYGPILSPRAISSNRMLVPMLHGIALVPRVPLEVTDVRDLAHLHLLALTSPAAIGHRYLAAPQHTTLPAIARLYARTYPERHIHPVAIPNGLTRIAAKFMPELRSLVPMLARRYRLSSAEATKDLGWQQRDCTITMLDSAISLLEFHIAQ
jgi:nucleoside-diphosphate-sugar epimerase